MRLGDLDALRTKAVPLLFPTAMEPCGRLSTPVTAVCVSEIEATPTIDPVHATGGCYCRECKYGSKQGGYNSVGEADTCVNCTRLVTQAHRGLIMPEDGFCSLGRPKEAQDG